MTITQPCMILSVSILSLYSSPMNIMLPNMRVFWSHSRDSFSSGESFSTSSNCVCRGGHERYMPLKNRRCRTNWSAGTFFSNSFWHRLRSSLRKFCFFPFSSNSGQAGCTLRHSWAYILLNCGSRIALSKIYHGIQKQRCNVNGQY